MCPSPRAPRRLPGRRPPTAPACRGTCTGRRLGPPPRPPHTGGGRHPDIINGLTAEQQTAATGAVNKHRGVRQVPLWPGAAALPDDGRSLSPRPPCAALQQLVQYLIVIAADARAGARRLVRVLLRPACCSPWFKYRGFFIQTVAEHGVLDAALYAWFMRYVCRGPQRGPQRTCLSRYFRGGSHSRFGPRQVDTAEE